jgi:CheY-like chemotaxis protein
MVEKAGFEAIEAIDADEAIRILESRNDIRAVFTDIQMPGSMDGLKLARAVRDRWPPVALIVTSGRTDISANDSAGTPFGATTANQPSNRKPGSVPGACSVGARHRFDKLSNYVPSSASVLLPQQRVGRDKVR